MTTSTETTATGAVVDFVVDTRLNKMPEDLIAEGKRCIVDGLGVMLAGSAAESSRVLRSYVRTIGGAGEATTIGEQPTRLPAPLAARLNGTAGHAHDYDDTQISTAPDRIFGLLTHPTVPVLAAGLAVAERESASGGAFLEAFLIGMEVECKIAEAISPAHYRNGFHSSGTIGAFGAAMTAAKLMGLTRQQVEHSIGVAASLTGGIRVNFGTMTKPLHVGRAAENGVTAADLARRGYTAGADALDGPWGFFQVFGGGFDPELISGALGAPYTLLDPGVSVKPYPCGCLGHPSMDAMLVLVSEHDIEPTTIEHIEFRAASNILNPLRYRVAKNELQAKFCVPFMLSAIALRRRAGIREFTDEFVQSPMVQEMMTKVELIHDPEIEARGFDKMRSHITVRTVDGRIFSKEAELYRGGPDWPFTTDDLRDKLQECVAGVLHDGAMPKILDAVQVIEEQPAIDPLLDTLLA